jgi:hypothetical protein
MVSWLNGNSSTIQAVSTVVQAVSTVVLTGVTIVYVRAASRQANAAERSTELLLQDHNEQVRLSPQIVSEAILDTQALIQFWTIQAISQARIMPDPQALTRSAIPAALPAARRISLRCASSLAQAAAALRDAAHEMENLREAHHENFQTGQRTAASKASESLTLAGKFLEEANERNTYAFGHTAHDEAMNVVYQFPVRDSHFPHGS